MTNEEQIAIKVACVQAAATLLADPNRPAINPRECARIAAMIYAHIVEIDWNASA
jgi:hypothetical protein